LTLDPRTTDNLIQNSEPVMNLNGKKYNNVFTFYYNHELGFVGFEDLSTNTIYNFE